MVPRVPMNVYLFKLAEFCNLNCSYCFMFNLRDFAFRQKPKKMSLDVFRAAVPKILDMARRQELSRISISFHGGEPLLVGQEWIRAAVGCFGDVHDIRVDFGVQTNGLLIDQSWMELFGEL